LGGEPLWSGLEEYHRKQDDFSYMKTVCVVSGSVGCGKTTYVLNYSKNKEFFYFSFAGFVEELAEVVKGVYSGVMHIKRRISARNEKYSLGVGTR